MFLGQKHISVKNFGSKKIFVLKKELGYKKNVGSKKIGVKKIFWAKIFLGQTNFSQNDQVQIFLSKKIGRVNPRERIYDPPPQKIVGLKLC